MFCISHVIYVSIHQRFIFSGNYSVLNEDMNCNSCSYKYVKGCTDPALSKGYSRLVEVDEK